MATATTAASVLRRTAARALARPTSVPLGVTALSVYVFVVVSRVSELVPVLHLGMMAMLAAVALLLVTRRRERPPTGTATDLGLVVALLALAAIGAPFSLWPGGSVSHLLNVHVKLVVLFAAIVFAVRTRWDLDRVLWGFVAAVFVLEMSLLASRAGGRAAVTRMYDPNDIAFVMTCALPVAAALAASTRGFARVAAGATALLAAPSIVLTGSRAGFVGLLTIGGLIMLRLTRGRPLTRVTVALAAGATLVLAAPPGYWDRIATTIGIESERSTEAGDDEAARVAEASRNYDRGGFRAARMGLWLRGLELMARHPLFGVGAAAFEVGDAALPGNFGRGTAAHNAFIEIGAELGLVALGVFVLLIVRGVRAARRVAARARGDAAPDAWLGRGLELALYGYVLVGCTLSQGYSTILYVLLGVTTSLANLGAPEET